MRKRGYSLIAVLLAIFCLFSISSAALLGNTLEFPQIAYNSTGTTHYDADSDLFTVKASPVAILLSAAADDSPIFFQGSLTINVKVDYTGALAGGVSGDDFVLKGTVDLGAYGVKSGVLLTGEVKEFGFYNSNTSTDKFDFGITLTGGELAFLFAGSDIGIVNISESSKFRGLFTEDFSGNAKGNIGAVTCDGSIGDLVWHDLNRNGIQDAGEPGIPNVSVKLTGTAGNPVSMTDITDANGKYLFLGLCEGTYEVEVDLSTVPAGFEATTPCSSDQAIGNDSNSDDMTDCTPLQTVDLPDLEGNTDNTTIDFGFITPDCTLKVTKTCFVKQPPTSDFDCSDAKPIDSLTMIWGGSNDIESIDVYRDKYDPNDPTKKLMYKIAGPIVTGDEVSASGYAAADARNDVDWAITFSDGTKGVSRFHRSCSDDDMNGPEDCGKAEGNSKDDKTGFINDWIFEGMAGLTSGFNCNPDLPGSTSECTFQQAPPSPHCEGKLEAIMLCYLGGSCPEPPLNTQPIDKQSCSGDADAVQPVRIVITDGGSKLFLDQGDVEINDLVTATAANAGENDFSSNTVFEIFDESGVLIQSGNFHTSCSQPLNLGDQFGSLQVVGMQTTEGGSIALGADVEYTYLVENMGDVAVFDVTVSDSVLGIVPGSAIESLDPNETVELFMTAFVDKTTTNIVTVTGETVFGDKCSAMDSATVTMLLPPPCIVSPVEFKISDDKIEWKLSNDGDKVVTINSIEVSWPDTLGDLKKVKREKDTIFEGPVPPPSATITSDMMRSDIKKRQIKPGESKKVKFEFASKASTVPGDYVITVNFAESCSVTFEPADIPFLCSDAKPIETLTLIWTDALPVTVTSESGQSFDITDDTEREVTFDVLGLGNDVDVDISGAVNGTSRFHVSCSDNEMNGLEDCGKPQGNGKDNNSGLNLWIFEGMAGNGLTLDCTP